MNKHKDPPQQAWPLQTNVARVAIALALTATLPAAHAARPMGTEDAATNAAAQCQLETWIDFGSDAKHGHIAPACGVGEGIELGFEAVYASPATEQVQARAVALKWAPDWLEWGGWRFALKASTLTQKNPGEGDWRQSTWSLLGIASLPINDKLTLHVNAGHQHDIDAQNNVNPISVSLTWAPCPRWQAFAEVIGDNKSSTAQSTGMRWWLLPDQLGLDLTATRTNATASSTVWGVGIGWYGLKF